MISAEEIKALKELDEVITINGKDYSYKAGLSTLQTLLNQAAESVKDILAQAQKGFFNPECGNRHFAIMERCDKALAAIEPYLTTGDTNE